VRLRFELHKYFISAAARTVTVALHRIYPIVNISAAALKTASSSQCVAASLANVSWCVFTPTFSTGAVSIAQLHCMCPCVCVCACVGGGMLPFCRLSLWEDWGCLPVHIVQAKLKEKAFELSCHTVSCVTWVPCHVSACDENAGKKAAADVPGRLERRCSWRAVQEQDHFFNSSMINGGQRRDQTTHCVRSKVLFLSTVKHKPGRQRRKAWKRFCPRCLCKHDRPRSLTDIST